MTSKFKTLSALLFLVPMMGFASVKSIDDPVNELLSILREYSEKISVADSEEKFKETQTELYDRIDLLSSKYPGFEPSSSEMKLVEDGFNSYIKAEDDAMERLDISIANDDEDDGDGSSSLMQFPDEVLDSLLEAYSDIPNKEDKMIAITKEYTEKNPLKVFEQVYGVILDRKANPKEGSYTNYLFDKGIDKILKKVGEEASEIIIASKNPDAGEIKYEISDFLYHMMVLMVERGVTWEEICSELAARE